MRILLRNLGSLPYSLDIGDFEGLGDCVRELLAPRDAPGDTVDIGGRVNPWDLNVQLSVRRMVVPDTSTRIVTALGSGLGYVVTASPPGQLEATFEQTPNDLMFLFFGGGGGSGLPPATSVGQVLFSFDGLTFTAQQPVTGPGGWLVNDEGVLLVTGGGGP